MADPTPAAHIPDTDPSPAPAPAPPAPASAPPAPIPRLLDPAHSRPPPSPTRVKAVNPRHFFHARNGPELITAWLGAIGAHKAVYDRVQGELHRDLNPNSILIIEHPQTAPAPVVGEDGGESEDSAPPFLTGAVIYWEPQISLQTLRKMDSPDPPWGRIGDKARDAMLMFCYKDQFERACRESAYWHSAEGLRERAEKGDGCMMERENGRWNAGGDGVWTRKKERDE